MDAGVQLVLVFGCEHLLGGHRAQRLFGLLLLDAQLLLLLGQPKEQTGLLLLDEGARGHALQELVGVGGGEERRGRRRYRGVLEVVDGRADETVVQLVDSAALAVHVGPQRLVAGLGLLHPHSGRVEVLGRDLSPMVEDLEALLHLADRGLVAAVGSVGFSGPLGGEHQTGNQCSSAHQGGADGEG